MYHEVWFGTFIIFLAIVIVIITIRLYKPQKNRCNKTFIIMCFFVFGWFLCELIRAASETILIFIYTMRLGLIFMELSSVASLMLAGSFYRLAYKPPRILHLLLYVVPVLTTLFSIVPRFWPLIYENDAIPESMFAFYFSVGSWFWVHTIFCYIILLLSAVVVLLGHFRIPKFYRFSSTLIVFAILQIPITHVISFTGHWPFQIPPLAVSLCVAIVFSHIALINSDLNIFVLHARGHIFKHIEESILVLGEDGFVADCNQKAAEWFSEHGIDLSLCTLQNIMETFKSMGAEIKEGPDNHDETDISFYGGAFYEVLSLRMHEIIDEKNRKIGSIAIFTDVTKNRDLFKRLEEKAGMDPLTGLANRMTYEGARKRLDTIDHYPLSVIVCDANGLKTINDKFGHKYGDKMIQVIAESLEVSCPKSGFVARIGGDEFIYLLSHTDEKAARSLIEKVQGILRQKSEYLPFGLSAAFGVATKYSEEEDLENVISQADIRMYEDKKRFNLSK